jgi:hypothetical protein
MELGIAMWVMMALMMAVMMGGGIYVGVRSRWRRRRGHDDSNSES